MAYRELAQQNAYAANEVTQLHASIVLCERRTNWLRGNRVLPGRKRGETFFTISPGYPLAIQ
jgi:hypothetical protein